jgi:hypothetical protein
MDSECRLPLSSPERAHFTSSVLPPPLGCLLWALTVLRHEGDCRLLSKKRRPVVKKYYSVPFTEMAEEYIR